MGLEQGQIIQGKYRIVRLIGEGGMGAVYEGENTRIRRRVAIKVLHAALAGSADVVKRFEREAQAAGRIGNDHILEVLDLGELADGDFFMVMEFLDGEPLSDRIRARGRLTAHDLSPIARQVLVGLGAAHDAGIIHRDLKPENIFLVREKAGHRDFVKIIDFGISKFQPLNSEMKMTQTGAVMGTPYYMSPEQARGSTDVDARSDLYAVGVILYEALTGAVPFEATSFNQLLFKIVLSEPTALQQRVPDVDPAFVTLVQKAMAREAVHRFQSAPEFIAALEAWERTGAGVALPPRSPNPSLAEITGNVEAVTADAAQQRGFVQSQPTLAMGQVAAPAQTSGNWAASQAGAVPARPSKTPLFATLGAAALIVVAGGGLVAWHFTRGGAPPIASASSGDSTSSAPRVVNAAEAPPASATEAPPASATEAPPASATEAPSVANRPPPKTSPTTKPAAEEKARTASRHSAKPAAKARLPAQKKPATSGTPDFGY
jgi:eukaryotic-like serine/threonine-protein kinase